MAVLFVQVHKNIHDNGVSLMTTVNFNHHHKILNSQNMFVRIPFFFFLNEVSPKSIYRGQCLTAPSQSVCKLTVVSFWECIFAHNSKRKGNGGAADSWETIKRLQNDVGNQQEGISLVRDILLSVCFAATACVCIAVINVGVFFTITATIYSFNVCLRGTLHINEHQYKTQMQILELASPLTCICSQVTANAQYINYTCVSDKCNPTRDKCKAVAINIVKSACFQVRELKCCHVWNVEWRHKSLKHQ